MIFGKKIIPSSFIHSLNLFIYSFILSFLFNQQLKDKLNSVVEKFKPPSSFNNDGNGFKKPTLVPSNDGFAVPSFLPPRAKGNYTVSTFLSMILLVLGPTLYRQCSAKPGKSKFLIPTKVTSYIFLCQSNTKIYH